MTIRLFGVAEDFAISLGLATARIPDELVLKTNLLGTNESIRERLRIHQAAGVKTINVTPEGQTIEERLTVLGQLIELVNEINGDDRSDRS